MPTREKVRELLDAGHNYQTAARELKLPAGQVYMIATGRPADGSDAPSPEALTAQHVGHGSTQHLVNPAAFNPTSKGFVPDWVRGRAVRELRASK